MGFRQSGGQVTEYGQVIAPNRSGYRQLWRGQRQRAVPARFEGRGRIYASKPGKFRHYQITQDGLRPVFFVGLFSRGSVEDEKRSGGVFGPAECGVSALLRGLLDGHGGLAVLRFQFRRCPSCCGLKALNDFGVFGGEIGFFSESV